MDESLKPFCRWVLQLSHVDQMAVEAVKYFEHFPCIIDSFSCVEDTYSRTILHRLANGFEAMAARWSKGAVTVVHGHPACGFYYLLEGRLLVENFEQQSGEVRKVAERIWLPGDSFTLHGVADRFDNGIHRIHVLEESLSFHIYSDDALKGQCFERVED